MRKIALLMASLGCLLTSPGEANGQDAPEEVRSIIDSLFNAMRAGNGQAAADLFHPDAVLYSIADQEGQPILRIDPAVGFVEAVGAPRTQVWDERISNVEIRIDGRLATAWMDYRFFIDDTLSHCGVNAIQLFGATKGWQIIQLTDTRRQEGCGDS